MGVKVAFEIFHKLDFTESVENLADCGEAHELRWRRTPGLPLFKDDGTYG